MMTNFPAKALIDRIAAAISDGGTCCRTVTDRAASAGSCLAADVAAKAAFLLSHDGPAWLDERGLAGRFRESEAFVENRAWNESLLESVA